MESRITLNESIDLMPFVDEINHTFIDQPLNVLCKTKMRLDQMEFVINTTLSKPVTNYNKFMHNNIVHLLDDVVKHINGSPDVIRLRGNVMEVSDSLQALMDEM